MTRDNVRSTTNDVLLHQAFRRRRQAEADFAHEQFMEMALRLTIVVLAVAAIVCAIWLA